MTLLAALDDFLTTTLTALPSLLTKLEYLSELRDAGGYSHWGMVRVHGEKAAKEALAEAHAMVTSEILRAPLRRLMEDAGTSSMAKDKELLAYLESLRRQSEVLLPERVGGGSTRHFSSVLHALSALARNQQRAIPPAS